MTAPYQEPPFPTQPEPPTLEERIRRLEVGLWQGGEPPQWVLDATANEPDPHVG